MDLLSACKLAYRKHHLNDDTIGWEELGDYLLDALCNEMGDDGFQEWLARKKVCGPVDVSPGMLLKIDQGRLPISVVGFGINKTTKEAEDMTKNVALKTKVFKSEITQKVLSLKTGIPESYLSQAINGRFNLNIKQKREIARVLKTDVAEIFDTE